MPRPQKGVYTSKYYTVPCPRCGAKVTRPCVKVTDIGVYGPKGSIALTPHPGRKKAYYKIHDQ